MTICSVIGAGRSMLAGRRRRGRVGLGALAVVGMLVLGACDLTGGGWMAGKYSGKATFGFDITCNTGSGFLNGTWTYHDKSAGVNMNGTLTDTSGGFDLDGLDGPLPCAIGSWPLTYTARPSKGTGHLQLAATDTGITGPNKGDKLEVVVLDGPYEGYVNVDQILLGGNLTVTP